MKKERLKAEISALLADVQPAGKVIPFQPKSPEPKPLPPFITIDSRVLVLAKMAIDQIAHELGVLSLLADYVPEEPQKRRK
ncbi:hypothetical protein [Geobacter sp.]|uniref:hypothetical protein n=1 Tax=Geobacter sp. TaxID=46610 RepID=UPI00262DCBAC|nr:hypothetical protein [Geobacter sp.]